MGFTEAFLILMLQEALIPSQQTLRRLREKEEGGSLGSGGQQASRFTGGKGLDFGRQPGNLQEGQGGEHQLMALFSLLNI